MKTQADVYERITTEIVEAIEAGCEEYRMPWNATAAGMPVNAASRRPYRGINILALWAAALKQTYKTNLWATYQQWADLGAQVRKGEKSTVVIFWKFCNGDEREVDDESAHEPKTRNTCFARAYNVFNADQVDGFSLPGILELPEAERKADAEAFFSQTGGKVIEAGARACYSPMTDEIRMPPFSLFRKSDFFYSTLAHEIVHWSGAPKRLNRDLSEGFGSEGYAVEELVAELGAAFLCAELGLSTDPREDHAPYIANWLQVLKNDKRAIFTAASKAQEAADWIVKTSNRNTREAA